MSKATKALYKSDKLFKVIFDLVSGKNKVGGIVKDKIKELITAEGTIERLKVYTNVSSNLYCTLLLKDNFSDKLDDVSDKHLKGFVIRCLNNILIDEYRRDKARDNFSVYEGQAAEKTKEEFNPIAYNRRPKEEPKKQKLLTLSDLKADGKLPDSVINSKEMIKLFKEFYGNDLIDVLLDGNELVDNYSLKEAIYFIGEGNNYNSMYKKLRRSKDGFVLFLKEKGITFIDNKHGVYFNYEV